MSFILVHFGLRQNHNFWKSPMQKSQQPTSSPFCCITDINQHFVSKVSGINLFFECREFYFQKRIKGKVFDFVDTFLRVSIFRRRLLIEEVSNLKYSQKWKKYCDFGAKDARNSKRMLQISKVTRKYLGRLYMNHINSVPNDCTFKKNLCRSLTLYDTCTKQLFIHINIIV